MRAVEPECSWRAKPKCGSREFGEWRREGSSTGQGDQREMETYCHENKPLLTLNSLPLQSHWIHRELTLGREPPPSRATLSIIALWIQQHVFTGVPKDNLSFLIYHSSNLIFSPLTQSQADVRNPERMLSIQYLKEGFLFSIKPPDPELIIENFIF